jgi:hypothetical protein
MIGRRHIRILAILMIAFLGVLALPQNTFDSASISTPTQANAASQSARSPASETFVPSAAKKKLKPFKRSNDPAVYSKLSSFVRKPINSRLTGFHGPCRKTAECIDGLVCKSGYCTSVDPLGKGEVGEVCSSESAGPVECLSGICRSGQCIASMQNKADNGYTCSFSWECRSDVCSDNMCLPSPRFKGLDGDACSSPADCISNSCLPASNGDGNVCGGNGLKASSCAAIGEAVQSPMECCSGKSDGVQCLPVESRDCTINGECRGRVGFVCADLGQEVLVSSQCCSGLENNRRCVINVRSRVQPCQSDRACRSGFCNLGTNTCEPLSSGESYYQKRKSAY